MLFEFFGKSYDSKQDKTAESYFKKMQKWIKDGSEAAKIQLKSILEKSKYAVTCLLEGSAATFDHRNQLIMESWSGENKGENMTIDEQIQNAFSSDKEEQVVEEDNSVYVVGHRLVNGKMVEITEESEKKREGSQTLTLDQQIAEAMK